MGARSAFEKLNCIFAIHDDKLPTLAATATVIVAIRMDEYAKDLLEQIGRQLDLAIFPVVKNDGIVMPSQTIVSSNPLGEEYQNEAAATRRSTTDTRSRTERRKWPPSGLRSARGSWTPGQAAPLVVSVGTAYQDPLNSVREAYPGVQMWKQEEGFWLHVRIALLPGLGRTASLLIAVAQKRRAVKAWAFWDVGVVGATWIGPRHTNFPDGSICAFEPADRTWQFGDSLVELVDLYSIWVLRHLHHEVFSLWPGPQSVPQLYERLLEVKDAELCGCGRTNLRYADCCKAGDLAANCIAEAMQFCNFSQWTLRKPPVSVQYFMWHRHEPPDIATVI